MFGLDYWIEGIITKNLALVSLDLDKRAKSCGCLKTKGYTTIKILTNGSLATKTNLIYERSLPRLI